MGKFDTNPFDRSALTDYRLLAGRSNEFKQIKFVLRNSAKQQHRFRHIFITGNRGVGKTSFLNLIETESKSHSLIPVRINLTETNSLNSNEFFWYLFSQTLNTIFNLNMLGGKGGEIDVTVQSILHSDGLDDIANWVFRTPILRKNYLNNNTSVFEFDQLITDFRSLRSLIIESKNNQFNDRTKILFLVDETQHIYSSSKILQDIRFIVQHADLGIGFVFAGDSSYIKSTWERIFGGSNRDFDIINLNYFEDVDAVTDYFTKSLQSIGWTTEEIEDTLFYKFKSACSNIFHLTSGKPAWINTIAKEMFERCMKGESPFLRFDRNAQNDVKNLLKNSGELDTVKIDFIENLSTNYQKWLEVLLDCERSTFNQVYFFSKFFLIDDNFINVEDFNQFCKNLISNGIIEFMENKSEALLGYEAKSVETNFGNIPYIAFGRNSDTIKQWLQISTEGKFSFSYNVPVNRFVKFINDELATESINTVLVNSFDSCENEPMRFSKIINLLNNKLYDITDLSYNNTYTLYKTFKRLSNSRERQILFGIFKNSKSNRYAAWNIYNFEANGKIVGFHNYPKKIEKFINNVSSYNNEENIFSLELCIDNVEIPNISYLQELIMNSEDRKKIGIILNDKMDDLMKYYVKESNLTSSHATALFFYDLFESGFDLSLRELNNSSYVFIANKNYEKALVLLNEAKKKLMCSNLDSNDSEVACLALYNQAMTYVLMGKYIEANDVFNDVIKFCLDKNKIDNIAVVLQILVLSENNIIGIEEIKEGNIEFPTINVFQIARNNIKILEDSGVLKV